MKFSSKFQSRDEQTNGSQDSGRYGRPKLPLLASLSNSSTSSSTSSTSSGSMSDQDQYSLDDDQSPPISPALRSPPCLSSASSISSWSQAGGSQSSPFDFDAECSNGSSSSSQCNSKEDRATYNTKFAKYHLETFRQNDRMRWNFDFDHNRPLEDSHHHHHQAVPRYQWEPTL